MLEARQQDALALLKVETNVNSGAFARTRLCPGCREVMVPWRIGTREAWIERCQHCDGLWIEAHDEKVLQGLRRQQAAQDTYASLSHEEKQELTEE